MKFDLAGLHSDIIVDFGNGAAIMMTTEPGQGNGVITANVGLFAGTTDYVAQTSAGRGNLPELTSIVKAGSNEGTHAAGRAVVSGMMYANARYSGAKLDLRIASVVGVHRQATNTYSGNCNNAAGAVLMFAGFAHSELVPFSRIRFDFAGRSVTGLRWGLTGGVRISP